MRRKSKNRKREDGEEESGERQRGKGEAYTYSPDSMSFRRGEYQPGACGSPSTCIELGPPGVVPPVVPGPPAVTASGFPGVSIKSL